MSRIAQVHGAAAGEGLRRASRAARHYTIEHVAAAHDRADEIARLADAHQVARAVFGQGGHCRVEHREHRLLSLADREAANGIADEAEDAVARPVDKCTA